MYSSSSSSSSAAEPEAQETTERAKRGHTILNLTPLHGDYLLGNVDPNIEPNNRGRKDFQKNKIKNPL